MIELKSVSKPVPSVQLEAVAAEAAPARVTTEGKTGTSSAEVSRSLKHLAVKGRGEPLRKPSLSAGLESIIGPTDERVRILDTDLAP